MYRRRGVLPDGIAPAFVRDELTLAGPDEVASSADEVLAAIARADRQDDESRLTILIAALARTERGPYLSGFTGTWVEARRYEINEILLGTRLDLARVAFRLGRYWEAASAIDSVLRADPYREEAWLFRMSLARASGTNDGVLAIYQRYVAAMREIDVPPSQEIQRQLGLMRS